MVDHAVHGHSEAAGSSGATRATAGALDGELDRRDGDGGHRGCGQADRHDVPLELPFQIEDPVAPSIELPDQDAELLAALGNLALQAAKGLVLRCGFRIFGVRAHGSHSFSVYVVWASAVDGASRGPVQRDAESAVPELEPTPHPDPQERGKSNS